jgi:ACS family tartrate transporter-like MFS transporter
MKVFNVTASDEALLRKVVWRIVPLVFLGSFMAYLDRVNLSFAALSMNAALGLSASKFGFGVGLFFAGSFIFSIPATIALKRLGGRRWLALIMVVWGLASMGMAFVSSPMSFYGFRFVLGVAETGFFPGVVLYLSYWLPEPQRSRAFALSMIALPFSVVVGGPLSGLLLNFTAFLGLQNWQWLFLTEGLPSILLGVLVYALFQDTPAQANWLPPEERARMIQRLETEEEVRLEEHGNSGSKMLIIRTVQLSAVVFCLNGVNYGVSFWTPQVIKGLGLTNLMTGLLSALPYIGGMIAMVGWVRVAPKIVGPKLELALPIVLAAAGLFLSTRSWHPWPTITCLTVAMIGIFATLPVVWSAPTTLIPREAARYSVAIISMTGLSAGFAIPFAMGIAKDMTGGFNAGFWMLSALGVIAALVSLTIDFGRGAARS